MKGLSLKSVIVKIKSKLRGNVASEDRDRVEVQEMSSSPVRTKELLSSSQECGHGSLTSEKSDSPSQFKISNQCRERACVTIILIAYLMICMTYSLLNTLFPNEVNKLSRAI